MRFRIMRYIELLGRRTVRRGRYPRPKVRGEMYEYRPLGSFYFRSTPPLSQLFTELSFLFSVTAPPRPHHPFTRHKSQERATRGSLLVLKLSAVSAQVILKDGYLLPTRTSSLSISEATVPTSFDRDFTTMRTRLRVASQPRATFDH